jgi:hypothetical protein
VHLQRGLLIGLENRATPTILRLVPAASDARLAIRASVGPIFPATPRMITSPGVRSKISMR